MKFFVASDIHGDSYWAERVVKAFEESKADKLVLLGDILYHGPRNDLPAHYEPKKVISLLNGYADKIIGQTNHKKVDIDTAIFLNRVAKLGLEFDETEENMNLVIAFILTFHMYIE